MSNRITNIRESALDTDQDGKRWEDYETIVCPDGQVIDMVQLLDDQYQAMAALHHLAPFLGGFIGKLRFVYTFHVKTQATDGNNIFVNPQFTANLDLTGKCFVMAHEIMHCLLNHMRRSKGHNHMRSNIAADYEVNATLADIKLFKVATMSNLNALINMDYVGKGYEEIYELVRVSGGDTMSNEEEANKARKNNGMSPQGGGSGSGKGNQIYSDDYKSGWAQAIADWQAGKIKV